MVRSSPSVDIRRAEHQDAPRIVELWMELARAHEATDERFRLKSDPEEAYLEQLRELLSNPDVACFVADIEGEVVGYILAMIWSNPGFFALERYGFVAEISVSTTSRNAGVGRQLWERARRWFRRKDVTVVQLNVSPQNATGIEFWAKQGFDEFLRILWTDIEKG